MCVFKKRTAYVMLGSLGGSEMGIRDWSGYASGRMDVKARVGGDVLLTRNTVNGGLFIDSATSSVFVRLAPTTLSAASLTAKDYVFDIELVTAGGAVDALCSADSVFSVQPEVTTSV